MRILDSEVFDEAFSFCGLRRPGGVTVLERGRTFGFLDDAHISIFDLRSMDSAAVSMQLNSDHRGNCLLHVFQGLSELKVTEIRSFSQSLALRVFAITSLLGINRVIFRCTWLCPK